MSATIAFAATPSPRQARTLRPVRTPAPQSCFSQSVFLSPRETDAAAVETGILHLRYARELGRWLFEDRPELRLRLEEGLEPRIFEGKPSFFDADLRFDRVVSYLRINPTSAGRFQLQTFFYRGDSLVASVVNDGLLASEELS